MPASAIRQATKGSSSQRSSSKPRDRHDRGEGARREQLDDRIARRRSAPPQSRQRPRSSSHESTGTLSSGRTGAPHDGQCEPGLTSDSPSGTR